MKTKSPLIWKTLDSQKGPDLIIFKTRYDQVQNPRNNTKMKAVVLESDDAVNVVAITKEHKVVLVKQYRFGIGKVTIEIPGGFIDKGETDLIAAQRELSEETGFTSPQWKPLGKIESNPAFVNSYVYHWLATDVEPKTQLKLDEGEAIEIVEMNLEEIKQHIQNGSIAHPHTLSALARVFQLWPTI